MNPPLPRGVLVDLCARLDHDPNRVQRIVITGTKIEVAYGHLVVDEKPAGRPHPATAPQPAPAAAKEPPARRGEVSTVPRLLTVDDVARILGIPKKSIYVARSEGRPTPPAIKVGKYLRWRREDVEQWLRDRQEAS